MKVSELHGRELDEWVMKARGLGGIEVAAPYSIEWAYCGPIIHAEGIEIAPCLDGTWVACKGRHRGLGNTYAQSGPDPMTAAMRCFVASKFGDEVHHDTV
jgi:hypothetical protein